MENNVSLGSWLKQMQLTHPLMIAGPCSAETESQVMAVATQLKDTDVNFFRAGIWKPRTRPGMFEGVGAPGLKWLQTVKAETGLKTAIEVANSAHVEQALAHDIDLLWIGARSTVSPFIVQEIADALRGTDRIVLVKNPVNPDLALWMGAIERLAKADVQHLGAIHRGFSTYEKSKYRNNPEWQLAIDLQTALPDLPLIIDPSHIAGRRDLIFDISQTALDLNYDGLMIETHCSPDQAWSDAAQQVLPVVLVEMMKDLKIRNASDPETDFNSNLDSFRARIDEVDAKVLELLVQRMQIADRIGALKKEKNVAVLQSQRWSEILVKMVLEGKEKGLSEAFILKMFKAIHEESIDHQKRVLRS